jgi:small subunit ribosomal protein S1
MSLSVKQLNEDPWRMVAEKFKVGEKIKGRITNITDFGIFVQLLEGVDGLVHISDISWTDHVSHPSERYKKDDNVEAVILAIDADNRKVSLGIKQLENDPWSSVGKEYKVGSMVEGTVSKITNFGAFIKLPTGVEGLVHISELSDKEVEKVEDILKVGETKQFRVIKVNPDERKLGLSLRPEREKVAPEHKEPKAAAEHKPAPQPKPQPQPVETHVQQKEAPAKGSLQQALEDHIKKQND